MLSELLKNTLADYPDETLIPLTEVDEKTGEKNKGIFDSFGRKCT